MLETLLDSVTAGIYFNLAGWAVMTDVGPESTVLIQGDVETSEGAIGDAPIAVHFDEPTGEGQIIYTSFSHVPAQEEQVKVIYHLLFHL